MYPAVLFLRSVFLPGHKPSIATIMHPKGYLDRDSSISLMHVTVIKGAIIYPSAFIANISRTLGPLRWSVPPISSPNLDYFLPIPQLSSK